MHSALRRTELNATRKTSVRFPSHLSAIWSATVALWVEAAPSLQVALSYLLYILLPMSMGCMPSVLTHTPAPSTPPCTYPCSRAHTPWTSMSLSTPSFPAHTHVSRVTYLHSLPIHITDRVNVLDAYVSQLKISLLFAYLRLHAANRGKPIICWGNQTILPWIRTFIPRNSENRTIQRGRPLSSMISPIILSY